MVERLIVTLRGILVSAYNAGKHDGSGHIPVHKSAEEYADDVIASFRKQLGL
jgi:hypothetical protein